jgi:hypothetical protein
VDVVLGAPFDPCHSGARRQVERSLATLNGDRVAA